MVSDIFVISITALTGLVIVAGALLRGWHSWLALRHRELDGPAGERHGDGSSGAASSKTRIELADLRERIRKLEAIASGVDL